MLKLTKRRIIFFIASIALFLTFAFSTIMFGPAIENASPMGAYLNGAFPITTPSGGSEVEVGYTVTNAFPNLTFIDPVDMVELPGQNEFLVVGVQGHIWKIANDENTTEKIELLDISDKVVTFQDGGMLGVVLHPEYGVTGSPNAEYVYVFYRYSPVDGTDRTSHRVNGYMRLSRFNLPVGANAINPASEEVLINIFDRHDWHNGGDMFFGPSDGFLYLSVGDEGLANDFYGVTQQIDKWLFSGVLRIDVDQKGGSISHPIRKQPQNAGIPPDGWPDSFTQGYYIPNDNPWQDVNGGILEEFYAIGTRSPHRMTYDAVTGDIWLGDIGQGAKEEISLVNKGDNLQWPYREGDQNGAKVMPDLLIGNEKEPIYAFGRSMGRSVIGGFVYRGNKYPELYGKYIFGDHETQNVWSLTKTGENSGDVNFLLNVPTHGAGSKDGISSFFIDSDQYMYILDLYGSARDGGVIRKIVRTGPILDPPKQLSQLNVFSDLENLTPVEGLIPYDVNAPLWSDGAAKKRWIALPNNGDYNTDLEQIGFEREGNWKFPSGTVLIKHFDLPINANNRNEVIKLETRFMVFTEDNKAYGVTYKWNEEQTDAYLIGIDEEVSQDYTVTKADGTQQTQTWNFPTRAQCIQCHNSVAGYALGLKTRQLNKNYAYPTGITGNQLETWNHLNIFSEDIGDEAKLPKSANINDANSSTEMKVRSYIDANCAYCHRPDGVEGAFDGRSLTALYDQYLIDTEVVSHASLPGYKIIAPNDYENSMLYMRDASMGDDRMPPVGRNLNDEEYLEQLIGWIEGIDSNGPASIEDGWYTLQAKHSAKFLAVSNAEMSNYAKIVQVSSSFDDYANWYVEHMGNSKYRITARHSNMVLSLGDLRTSKGADVVQESWSGEQHQLWYFEENEQGGYHIVNAYNGLVLDVFRNRVTDGTKILSWLKKSVNMENQTWMLNRSSSDFASIGETGKVSADDKWLTVSLDKEYLEPVVIAGGLGYNGGDQSTVRIQNVTSDSFEIRIDEWECLDETHEFEDISYIVVEAGVYELPNGKKLHAGNIDGVDDNWYTHQFSSAFENAPLVFGQCVTENEAEAVNVFIDEQNTNSSQLRIKLKEQDKATGGHALERVSWLAVEGGSHEDEQIKFEISDTGRTIDHKWKTINFIQNYSNSLLFIGEIASEYGGDAATLRYRNLAGNSVDIFVEEERCGDSETNHTTETINFMVFNEPGVFYGKVHEENLVATTLKAKFTVPNNFYFTNVSTKSDSYVVDLNWTTLADDNIAYYQVERSLDNFNFNVVSDQPSMQSIEGSSYSGYDENPVIGESFYRIAAVTVNGEKTYSQTVDIDFKIFDVNMLVYPNAVKRNEMLTLDILMTDRQNEKLMISLYTMSGQLITSFNKTIVNPQEFYQIDTARLESGTYILKVRGSNWSRSKVFIVN
ncbi:MAG: PQQ-dependent sugar dehydrogenase [Maribacter sp.]|nr:PQQ-dependent sugar dehydrogenase [Maribacter sp.]